MKVQRLILVALFMLFGGLAVFVVSSQAAENPCDTATTTAEMRNCLARQYAQVDGELNRVYKQLMSQLDRERQPMLKEAQSAWIRFRDSNAAFAAGSVKGGTLYPVIEMADRIATTEQRIAQLKTYLK